MRAEITFKYKVSLNNCLEIKRQKTKIYHYATAYRTRAEGIEIEYGTEEGKQMDRYLNNEIVEVKIYE